MLTYHPTIEAEKEAICAWQYPGEYAMYNNPPYARSTDTVLRIRQTISIPFTMAKRWWAS